MSGNVCDLKEVLMYGDDDETFGVRSVQVSY